jgi:hypothetical protein
MRLGWSVLLCQKQSHQTQGQKDLVLIKVICFCNIQFGGERMQPSADWVKLPESSPQRKHCHDETHWCIQDPPVGPSLTPQPPVIPAHSSTTHRWVSAQSNLAHSHKAHYHLLTLRPLKPSCSKSTLLPESTAPPQLFLEVFPRLSWLFCI